MNKYISELVTRYPQLSGIACDIENAVNAIINSYKNEGKLLLCGNGGSAADCSHIVGELQKGFLKKRPTDSDDPIISKLQGGLPAISLCESVSIFTAFCNDVDPDLVFAQQTFALGKKGDVLIGITTSGNSSNVLKAMHTAQKIGMKTIGLTGGDGGKLKDKSDVCIIAPETETFKVQELHLAVYHAICAAVEEEFFKV